VDIPARASANSFEDPRLGMMAAPQVRASATPARQRFVLVAPKASDLLLGESWLRHEVPRNAAKASRRRVR